MVIEVDPLHIVNGLIANELIALHVRNDVTSMSAIAYEKANKIIRGILEADGNTVQFFK